MNFGFTEDQVAFQAAMRDLLADACPPPAVRAAWTGGPGFDAALWERLGEMGVLGVLAPESSGGLGLGFVDLILILEETGWAGFPGPIVEHAAVAVPALAEAGQASLCEEAASGAIVVTAARDLTRVGWGGEADVALIGSDGAVIVVRPADHRSLSPLESVDRSRRDVAMLVGDGAVSLAGVDAGSAFDRGALGAAAQLCGLADRMIRMTVEYVGQRRQFGVPVGSYQAVKHHLSNAFLRLEHARPAVYRAAYSIDTGSPDRSRDVSMAKVMAGDAGALAARVALQCHGAIGYTWESDLHLWMKRVWVLERAWGTTATHRRRVADAVLG
jgi:alkylation response protein AidB-like acyl-CoA dehydrogenase